MTISQLTGLSPVVVPNPEVPLTPDGHGGIELTVVTPIDEDLDTMIMVVTEVCRALYAQCITFEVLAVTDGTEEAVRQALAMVPRLRVARADVEDWNAVREAGLKAADGRWIGFVDFPDEVGVDGYDFVECLHQAKEAAAQMLL